MTFYPPKSLYEAEIEKAIQEGALDNLPGKGKPLNIRENPYVPEGWRMSFNVLEQGGCVPPEVETLKEIEKKRAELSAATTDEARAAKRKELAYLRTKLAVELERFTRK